MTRRSPWVFVALFACSEPEAIPAATAERPPAADGGSTAERPPAPPAQLEGGWAWLDRSDVVYVDASRSSQRTQIEFADSWDEMSTLDRRQRLQDELREVASSGESRGRTAATIEAEIAAIDSPAPRRIAMAILGERDGWVELETIPQDAERSICDHRLSGLDKFRVRLYIPRAQLNEADLLAADAELPTCRPRAKSALEPETSVVALQHGSRESLIEPPAKEYEVPAGTKASWPDGRRAGSVAVTHRYPEAPQARGDQSCFPLKMGSGTEATLQICFDAETVKEVEPPLNDRRNQDLLIAQNAGVLGLLAQDSTLGSPFGSAFLGGELDDAALGGLIGDSFDEAYGMGGLGLVGTGRGGGGSGEGTLGLGSLGTMGLGGGGGSGGAGLGRKQVSGTATVAATTTSGISKKTAEATLRRMKNSFRYCYERLLRTDADASGAVALSLTLSDAGKVTTADVTGGLDESTRGCVARSARRARFPEGGTVAATITFALKD